MESFFNSLLVNFFIVIKKYGVFQGRAHRREYWMFVLANFIVAVALSILSGLPLLGKLFVAISVIYSLAILIPGIAVSVRRLHDTNRSGLFMLLGIIPVAGIIALLVFCAQEGNPGENQYGTGLKTE
jgi:uncharacterized membrane protein YhaH (DUF805 family)